MDTSHQMSIESGVSDKEMDERRNGADEMADRIDEMAKRTNR